MSDRRTKEQIIEELDKAQRQIAALEAKIPSPPVNVPVAAALAGAIRALDPLAKTKAGYSAYDDQKRLNATTELVGVMKHLLHRYGIDLTERTTEPCERRHLDDVTDAELIDRLRGFRR